MNKEKKLHLDIRTQKAAKGIILSLAAKGISIICSFLLVPLTIKYVNPTQYGIWLTMSSIIGWIVFFDLGLGNGFRNKFAEAKARGELNLAREYVSTTYFAVGTIILLIYSSLAIINSFIDWTSILKISPSYQEELHKVFLIVSAFFCISLVVNLFSTLLTADQEPGYAAAANGLGQLISLATIFILTKTTSGSLLNLSLYYSGIPCLTMLVCSAIAFSCTKYKQYSPSHKFINTTLIKSILGKGIQFFLISISLIVIFQMINVIISREVGPIAVTEYNIANKYFNVLYMMTGIIITPFWSAFTDAFTQKDIIWMKRTIRFMERIFILLMFIAILMVFFAKPFYRFWLQNNPGVEIPFALSLMMAIYTLSRCLGDIYMYMINGIGTIRIQLIAYLGFAIIAWPCMTWSCQKFGVYGVIVIPTLACLTQAFLGKVQLMKLLYSKASGIWVK